jgi:hypothetical protein
MEPRGNGWKTKGNTVAHCQRPEAVLEPKLLTCVFSGYHNSGNTDKVRKAAEKRHGYVGPQLKEDDTAEAITATGTRSTLIEARNERHDKRLRI